MIQTLVPRPIAWVLSENANSSYNLAPFSYFAGVSSDPPLLMLSIGEKPGGEPKDTRVNIIEREHFVVHIAHGEQADQLNESSRVLAAGESEITAADIELAKFTGVSLPRLAGCRVAFACKRYRVEAITDSQTMILGLVTHVYIDDAIAQYDDKQRLSVDVNGLNPLARLGGDEYALLGKTFSIPRPR